MNMNDRARSLLRELERVDVTDYFGQSLLTTQKWSRDHIDSVVLTAELLGALDRKRVPLDLFPNELFCALFFDASTRTKSSWAGAAARLGAKPVIFEGSGTQVSHGETSEETGAMLGMNSHALGIRHDLILGQGQSFMQAARSGIADYLDATGDLRKVPVVNLQCDVDHPTQTLADLCWLKEVFPQGLEGRKIAVSWAYSPSYAKPLSVPQGLLTLLTRFGMDVHLAYPEGYDLIPACVEDAKRNAAESGGRLVLTHNMDEAFQGADAVYPKSWGPYDLMLERVTASEHGDTARMRQIEDEALARNKAFTDWICDERRMGLTRDQNALYLHCLPADIGAEVSPGVMDQFRVHVAREANKKVYVIMAALALAKEPALAEALRDRLKGQD